MVGMLRTLALADNARGLSESNKRSNVEVSACPCCTVSTDSHGGHATHACIGRQCTRAIRE